MIIDRSRRSTRRAAVLALRIVVSVAMLTILIARIPTDELDDLWPDWTLSTFGWLVGAIVATAGAFVLAAARWHEVAITLGMKAPLGSLVNHYLAGQFVGNFLPTTIGGDVLRVTRLGRDTTDRPNAFASVIIERLTGWVVLPLLTIIALAINRGLLRETSGRIALAIALATLLVLFAIVYLAEHPKIGGRIVGETALRQRLGAVHTGLSTYRREPAAAVRLIAVAIAYQCLLVSAMGMAAAAMGVRPGPTAWLAFAPMVLIVQVLPVAIGGLGVREGALVVFLGAHGVSDGQAVSLGLVLYALNLIVSLLGAPSFALGAHNGDGDDTTRKPFKDNGNRGAS